LDAALAALAAPVRGAKVVALRPPRSLARRAAAIGIPLAAAAAVAGVLLLPPRGGAPERAGVTAERIARAIYPRQPLVRPAAGKHAAVMNTSDPGVTVVWIY